MLRSAKMTGLVLSGLALSIALQGCATTRAADRPVAIGVAVKDQPPADLLACADRPAALPVDQIAILPAALRIGLITIARALAANADRLDRLVRWHAPATCPEVR